MALLGRVIESLRLIRKLAEEARRQRGRRLAAATGALRHGRRGRAAAEGNGSRGAGSITDAPGPPCPLPRRPAVSPVGSAGRHDGPVSRPLTARLDAPAPQVSPPFAFETYPRAPARAAVIARRIGAEGDPGPAAGDGSVRGKCRR